MLEALRKQLDQINIDLVQLIKKRVEIIAEIARFKKTHRLRICQPERERELRRQIVQEGEKQGVDSSLLEDILELLMEHSKKEQRKV